MSKVYDTCDLRGVEAVDGGAGRRDRRERGGGSVVGRIEIGLDEREKLALLGVDGLVRGAQRSDRRLQRGIVVQRSLDQRIERRRSEQPPPFLRNIAALHETLRLPGRRIGRGGSRRQRLLGVAADFGRGGMEEIRTDRATGQTERGRERGGAPVKPPD